MKQFLILLSFFTFSLVNAQLYVSASKDHDTYLYVRDRLLFVEKSIEISEAKKNQELAGIYLRKEAQLLQGDKTENLNTGSGKLSVFQEGTSNAYDYNYWGLPVKLSSNDHQLNDILYEPLDQLESVNVKLVSSLEGKSSPLIISRRWLYTFTGNSYSNWAYVGDHFDLLPGEGFSMKGVNGTNLKLIEGNPINPGSAQTYDFRGVPNDGLIELPIKKDQILLVGNPYPSALDLNTFLLENSSCTGIAYFWDSKPDGNSHYLSDYEGGYGTYSAGTGLYAPAVFQSYQSGAETNGHGKVYSRRIVPIAQGFMIMGRSDGKVKFRNSQRRFQKEATGVSEFKTMENPLSSLRLHVDFDSIYTRQLILAFRNDATTEEDNGLDALKIDRVSKDIHWLVADQAFVINVRPRTDKELIPLEILLDNDSEIKFSIGELNDFNPDRIFIYDAQDDLYFGIKTGYLKMTLPAGEYKNRFYLSFLEKLPVENQAPESNNNSKETPDVTETINIKPRNVLLNTIDIFQNNRDQQLEIKILYEADLKSISLYDLNGKLIFTSTPKTTLKDFKQSTGNLANAVYIVKVKTSDHLELTKKISVKN